MMKNVHVIQHTHWDFEWYFTRNEALVQFVYHMDEVFNALEHEVVDYYLLDGQMSILDDYLEACPEKKAVIKYWVQAGKLFIGPWYTQTDELIITGESIIRNLLIGTELADQLGGSQSIGYLPDSFGQSQDMPKIYQGMDIGNAVFWRGLSQDKTTDREFNWRAEDGSEVTTINIKDGYFVGVGLIEDDQVDHVIKTVVTDSTQNDIALPVGGDQRYVDYNLKERIKFYNQALKSRDIQLHESNYPALFERINQHKKELKTVTGEFIAPSVSKIHRSIYSSRYDHKYLNDKVERRMIYQLEPLMMMADRAGICYKADLLTKIWKLIVRNHAHDSAGGCNSDKTNQIILERLREADQLSYSTVDYLTRKIAESRVDVQENEVTFFNTLPYEITKTVKFQVSMKTANFSLWDADCELAVDILKKERRYHGQIKRNTADYQQDDYYYVFDCETVVTLPALQWQTYQIKSDSLAMTEIDLLENKTIKNEFYQVIYQKGRLTLTDLVGQQQYTDFLTVEDGGDEGDTYDYSPAYRDDINYYHFEGATVKTQIGRCAQKMIISGHWLVAADLAERKQRQQSGTIAYVLELEVNNNRQLMLNLKINNQAKDHRMRLLVNTPIKAQHSYADTAFGLIKRSLVDSHLKDWQTIGWHEEPSAIYPMLHYVNTHDTQNSWSIFAKGIKEYQLVGQDYQQVALTLFRSVGFLGRPDLIRRPGVASGNQFRYIETPDSQLQSELHFKLALQIETQFNAASTMRDFQIYATNIESYQIQTLNQFTNTLKYFVMHPTIEPVRSVPSFEMLSTQLVYSSVTKAKDESGWLYRIYNPQAYKVSGANIARLDQKRTIETVNFKGETRQLLGTAAVITTADFKPGEIKTFKVY